MISQAIQNLRPNASWKLVGEDYAGIEWLDESQGKPSKAEVENEIDRLAMQAPLEACKAEAKRRIALSDWASLPDVGLQNSAEFVQCRKALRALIISPVAAPEWPAEPQPIWAAPGGAGL